MWNESDAGRGANEIASALVTLLNRIVTDIPDDINTLILWSNSCVAQNRNSVITTALKHFQSLHVDIETIHQQFCEPGHSAIQEVDSLHSQIERALNVSEIYSPVSLLRVLLKACRRKPLVVCQMKHEDF